MTHEFKTCRVSRLMDSSKRPEPRTLHRTMSVSPASPVLPRPPGSCLIRLLAAPLRCCESCRLPPPSHAHAPTILPPPTGPDNTVSMSSTDNRNSLLIQLSKEIVLKRYYLVECSTRMIVNLHRHYITNCTTVILQAVYRDCRLTISIMQ